MCAVVIRDDISPQALRDWVHRYNQAGIAGLSNRVAPGRSPKLTEARWQR